MLRSTFRRSSTLPCGWPLAYFLYDLNFCVLNFFFILKTWSCIFKNWIFAVKEFRTKNMLFENTCLCKKNCHKKFNWVKFQMFIIQVKKNQIQNYVKCHIIFSFVKWHLSIIKIYTIQIQIVLSYYELHSNTAPTCLLTFIRVLVNCLLNIC